MIDMNYERNIAMIAGYYAEEHQLIQTAEECAELAKAAIKRRNALEDIATPADVLKASRLALIEEIADVLVMCEQLIYLEGCEGDVRRVMDEKMQRQIGRIRTSDQKSDIQPVKFGEWHGTVCTVCGGSTSDYYDCKFCPKCGAKMELEE